MTLRSGLGDFQFSADFQDHKISAGAGSSKTCRSRRDTGKASGNMYQKRDAREMMQVQERKAHYRLLDVFPKDKKKGEWY